MSSLNFLQARCSSWRPTNSVKHWRQSFPKQVCLISPETCISPLVLRRISSQNCISVPESITSKSSNGGANNLVKRYFCWPLVVHVEKLVKFVCLFVHTVTYERNHLWRGYLAFWFTSTLVYFMFEVKGIIKSSQSQWLVWPQVKAV